ncbi:MAG: hypothetical protein LBF85_07235 [Tannerella sp.]|nr:hypothetical protein [Tannerella sp.]
MSCQRLAVMTEMPLLSAMASVVFARHEAIRQEGGASLSVAAVPQNKRKHVRAKTAAGLFRRTSPFSGQTAGKSRKNMNEIERRLRRPGREAIQRTDRALLIFQPPRYAPSGRMFISRQWIWTAYSLRHRLR